MTHLTILNMGLALRSVVYDHYPTARHAADSLDIEESELRRAWVRSKTGNHASYQRMIDTLSKLGYEVHFSIRRKGEDSDADCILHIDNSTKGMPVHNGRVSQGDE
jgi:hypothetical protein